MKIGEFRYFIKYIKVSPFYFVTGPGSLWLSAVLKMCIRYLTYLKVL